jgi:hypothetical protein
MRQILLVTIVFLGAFSLLLSLQVFWVKWLLPMIYVLGLLAAVLGKAKSAPVSTDSRTQIRSAAADLARIVLPLLVLGLCLQVPLTPFEGVAELFQRSHWKTLDPFLQGFRALLALLLAHATYICLCNATDPRKLAQNSILLAFFFALVAGSVGLTTVARFRDDQRGVMREATILRSEAIDLKGGPIPSGIGRPSQSRLGEFIVVFTVEFQDYDRTRTARLWKGDFFAEKRWADMLVQANPPGSQREVFHMQVGTDENLVLHYDEPSGFDYFEANPNWKRTDQNPER